MFNNFFREIINRIKNLTRNNRERTWKATFRVIIKSNTTARATQTR